MVVKDAEARGGTDLGWGSLRVMTKETRVLVQIGDFFV
jgi:hypothetical protein